MAANARASQVVANHDVDYETDECLPQGRTLATSVNPVSRYDLKLKYILISFEIYPARQWLKRSM